MPCFDPPLGSPAPAGWSHFEAWIDRSTGPDSHGGPYSEFSFIDRAGNMSRGFGYLTDAVAEKAAAFLEHNSDTPWTGPLSEAQARATPWFLLVSPPLPLPFMPAPRHAGLFNTSQAPRSLPYNGSVAGRAGWVSALPPLSARDAIEIDNEYRQRLRVMVAVDELVDKVLGSMSETSAFPAGRCSAAGSAFVCYDQ